jgi:perosamine synthetase
MGRLDEILDRRAGRALQYSRELRAIPEVTAPQLEIDGGRICWFGFVVQLAAHFTRADRDSICAYLTQHGIGSGRYFAPIHRQPLYARFASGELPVTDHVSDRTLALPFFNALRDEQIADVCGTLRDAIRSAVTSPPASRDPSASTHRP